MKLLSSCSAALIALGLSFVAARPALADTYTYTGNDFTTAAPPYSLSDSISGSFTVTGALGDNLNLATIAPTSFSFTDGPDVLTVANSTPILEISTDAEGDITGWQIAIHSTDAIIETDDSPAYDFDMVLYGNGQIPYAYNYDPGTWSEVAATPEPSSLLLLGTGVLGMAGMVRRRLCR